MARDSFDPSDIRKSDMNRLADSLEEYLTLLTEVMIFPEDIKKKCQHKMQAGIQTTEKLIKKLRKGDKSVFKDEDEWETF